MPFTDPASWVIRERSTRRVILETWNPALVAKLNVERYEAVPILSYLQEINREARKALTNT